MSFNIPITTIRITSNPSNEIIHIVIDKFLNGQEIPTEYTNKKEFVYDNQTYVIDAKTKQRYVLCEDNDNDEIEFGINNMKHLPTNLEDEVTIVFDFNSTKCNVEVSYYRFNIHKSDLLLRNYKYDLVKTNKYTFDIL
jgi:hypothetical protein